MSASTYPVHVDARLDSSHLSRGLWLVKWLLAVPHYLVLVFLWAAFLVLSVVAFFAILLTGRYPRAIFDFNVGVMRWTWRVAYYAYGALGTDQYPPFTLAERADYPAHLQVDYPEHLSRGLVLVKWWLLAIPHYLVLGLLAGGGAYVAVDRDVGDQDLVWNTGLIGLLVCVAGVVLLFTGRYPQPLFDLVLGLNRWCLRVAGYVALMTDQYPPFRLDQGGTEARTALTDAPPVGPAPVGPVGPPPGWTAPGGPAPGPAPAGPVGAGEQRRGWTAGAVVSVVAGSVLVLMSLGLGAAGTALAVADGQLRDEGGFLMTDDVAVTSAGYAVTSEAMEIHSDVTSVSLPHELLGDAKVTASSVTGAPVFIGIAKAADAERYLAGVAHSTVVGYTDAAEYDNVTGGAPSSAPGALDIWASRAQGTGTQEMVWPVDTGDWTLVVMNADGTAGVDARVAVGAEVPALDWLVPTLLVAAGVGLVLGVVLIVVPVRAASRSGR